MDLKDTETNEGSDPLIFGRVLDGKGGARPIDRHNVDNWKPDVAGEILWLHLRRDAPEVLPWLQNDLGIPEPTAELLVSSATRPRALREGDTLVATLRGINFNPDAEPEDMISLQLWSDGRRLITLRKQAMQTPRDIVALLDAGKGPTDAGKAITEIVEQLVLRMNDTIVAMNDQIDQLEDMDIEEDYEEILPRITSIRRNSLALKRHMAPQHEALERISRDAPSWFEEHDRREIAESIDRLRRYLDDIDISKESAVVLQDELRARSMASNEHATYMLTIVAGIFLPLGFLTGLMGINVGGMPGVEDGDAFWIVVALCFGIMALQLFLFWRWKWL
ncbi:zinc transporter ZntB [Erythrobacter sp. SCSIO 43205]|uniref:zinc transporter ZntB n=1 Tax=Erythrobacter sp. SCSIO 43205 TaxID=2779361 RepID=UPI001CA853E8|nr:zinc transporter ZntB [Erythrobacter sp. SCSIO 43205]UAB78143.1 zinc transporter ZntB [Erythrobacter sp. SCSIO 43205]